MAFEPETLSRMMKVKRAEKGWNQQELADAAGISLGSVARYESCKNVPTFPQAIDIANALGCSLDELCGREGG